MIKNLLFANKQPQVPADPYYNSVQLWLRGDERVNGEVVDSSKNGYIVQSNPYIDIVTPGRIGSGCLSFNGSRYLSVSHTPQLSVGHNWFTVEMWLNPTNLIHQPFVWSKSTGTGTTTGWFIQVDQYGNVHFGNGTQSAGVQFASFSARRIPIGQWTHLALTRKMFTVYCAVNGNVESKTFTNVTTLADNTAPMRIGTWTGSGAYMYNGLMDDFKYTHDAKYTTNFNPSSW